MMKPLFEDIETRWAAQLLHEHRTICWRYNVFLSSPVINISSGRNTLGCWNDRTKTISISSHLIENEVWDLVLEVLKHEMAHQYVSEYYDHADCHGNYFKLACQKLGVHPAFMTSGKNNIQQLEIFKGTLPDEARKMIRKVEKLMALGQSGNEAEARAASGKANYLLNKYNLKQTMTHPNHPNIHYLSICHGKKRIESIQRAILSVLQTYYHVDCLTTNTYNAQDDSVYKCIVLIGKKEAIAVAEYVYHFFLDCSRTLWKNFKKQTHAPAGDKLSFDMGFISGIELNHRRTLQSSRVASNKDTFLPEKAVKALMEQTRAENRIEVSRLFPRLRTVSYGRHSTVSDAFKKGFEDGKNTQVKRGVTGQEKPVRLIDKPAC